MPTYKHDGPVDCVAAFDASNVQGKLAIVTGGELAPSGLGSVRIPNADRPQGANGLGEAYVRALQSAG